MRFLLNSLANKCHNVYIRNKSPSARIIMHEQHDGPSTTTSTTTSSTCSIGSSCGTNSMMIPNSIRDEKLHEYHENIWSQQCGPYCGCLLRIQIQVDPFDEYRIQSAEYHTKSLVLEQKVLEKMQKREMKEDGTWHTVIETRYGQAPLLTYNRRVFDEYDNHDGFSSTISSTTSHGHGQGHFSRSIDGRPIITSCTCKPLKQLANAVCSYLPRQGMTISAFKNTLEFQSNRASAGFRQHILTMIDASSRSAEKCFDLVENALIGLSRGYDADEVEALRKGADLDTVPFIKSSFQQEANECKSIANRPLLKNQDSIASLR